MSSFAGLGMFLFGMTLLELSLKEAAGRSFKDIIKKSTDTIPRSILTGAASTAVLQSSSVVSLIVLSLVGAGILHLKSGIGVVFGANMGTTATAWIVAMLGFKVRIDALVLPIIGIGGLILTFFRESRRMNVAGKVLVGFGMLFLGLGFIRNGMSGMAHVDMAGFSHYGPLVFMLIGLALTAVIQSSSATAAVTLSALGAGVITFDMSTAMVIGANMGTTVTAALGALGGVPDKKRVAAAHFLFNISTAVVAFILMGRINDFILYRLGLAQDPITALAIFHTLFNLIGVVIMTPFIPILAEFLNTHFMYREKTITHYLHRVTHDVPDAAITALTGETVHLLRLGMKFALLIFNIRPGDVLQYRAKTKEILKKNRGVLNVKYDEIYRKVKLLEVKIITFASAVKARELSDSEVEAVDKIVQAARETALAAKALKDIREDIDQFILSDNVLIGKAYEHFRASIIRLLKNISRLSDGQRGRGTRVRQIFEDIRRDNERSVVFVAEAIRSGSLDESQAATLINVNNSVYNASAYFLNSAKLLFSI